MNVAVTDACIFIDLIELRPALLPKAIEELLKLYLLQTY
jgi:hypothetical protein